MNYKLFLLAVLLVSLSSCEAVKGIFKAGFWMGAIVIIAVVLIVILLVGKKKE